MLRVCKVFEGPLCLEVDKAAPLRPRVCGLHKHAKRKAGRAVKGVKASAPFTCAPMWLHARAPSYTSPLTRASSSSFMTSASCVIRFTRFAFRLRFRPWR